VNEYIGKMRWRLAFESNFFNIRCCSERDFKFWTAAGVECQWGNPKYSIRRQAS